MIGQSGGPSGYYLMYIAMMFQLSYQFNCLCDWTVWGSLWILSDVYSNDVHNVSYQLTFASVIGQSGGPSSGYYLMYIAMMLFNYLTSSIRLCDCLNIKLSIFLHWISLNKRASAMYFRTSFVITDTHTFSRTKTSSDDQSGPHAFRI